MAMMAYAVLGLSPYPAPLLLPEWWEPPARRT